MLQSLFYYMFLLAFFSLFKLGKAELLKGDDVLMLKHDYDDYVSEIDHEDWVYLGIGLFLLASSILTCAYCILRRRRTQNAELIVSLVDNKPKDGSRNQVENEPLGLQNNETNRSVSYPQFENPESYQPYNPQSFNAHYQHPNPSYQPQSNVQNQHLIPRYQSHPYVQSPQHQIPPFIQNPQYQGHANPGQYPSLYPTS